MRTFSEKEIENYMKYVDENIIDLEEIIGRCFMCGQKLDEVELPNGPEKKVTCKECRDFFVEQFEEAEEMGEFSND